jgi:hypothetical protein
MGILLYAPQYAFFHIHCLCSSVSSMVCHGRVNSTGHLDDQWHKMCMGLEVDIEDTSLFTTLQLQPQALQRINCVSTYSWNMLSILSTDLQSNFDTGT